MATEEDLDTLRPYDRHIRKSERQNSVWLGRVILAEEDGKFLGWLRWNLFWDNTPFMTMLYLLEDFRGKGIGTQLIQYWETRMKKEKDRILLTSSQSDETAQHFYRKRNWQDYGSLLLPKEPLEIIFIKQI